LPIYVDYTAAPTSELVQGPDGYKDFLASVADGADKLKTLLLYERGKCPSSKLILAGYSQGALAIHEDIVGYATANGIAAIDLIADPERTPKGAGSNLGTAGAHSGIYSFRFAGTPLPSYLSNITTSLCDSDDVVCDFTSPYYAVVAANLLGGLTWKLVGAVLIKHGVDVHTSYYSKDASKLKSMGSSAAKAAT
jgi:hypothetical protein